MKCNSKFPRLCIAVVLLIALAVGIMPAAAAVDDTAPFSVNDQRTYEKDNFMLKYDVNSSFTLPAGWEIIEDYGDFIPGLLHVKIPGNITVKDAIGYFATIDGVIYAEPNYTSSMGQSQTDAKRIYSGYRQDRIEVYYKNASGEHLPWDVIYEFEMYPAEYEEHVLLQIPAGMTLVEAIEYCKTIGNIHHTNPGDEYIYCVVQGNSYDLTSIRTDVIWVEYDTDTSFRLPWELNYELYGTYQYTIPEGMTFAEAFAYCNTIDEIVHVSYDFRAQLADGGSSILPTGSPVPVAGVLGGLLGAGILLLFRRK